MVDGWQTSSKGAVSVTSMKWTKGVAALLLLFATLRATNASDCEQVRPQKEEPSSNAQLAGFEVFSDGSCHDCGSTGCHGQCCRCWGHTSGVFVDLLYLQTNDVAVPYAVLQQSSSNFIPAGPMATVEPSADAGIRGGVRYALNEASSLSAQYTWFETGSTDAIEAPNAMANGLVPAGMPALGALTVLPGTFDPMTARSGRADAAYDIQMQMIDLDYRWILGARPRYAVNGLVGASYGRLEQRLQVTQAQNDQNFPGTNSPLMVASNVNIEGGGIRLGLDGTALIGSCGLELYGQGVATILVGNVRGRFSQMSPAQAPAVNAVLEFKERRTVPILQAAAGIAWTSASGHFRVKTGYQYMAWLNSLPMRDFIQAVQTQGFSDAGDTTSFDGFVVRVELMR